MMESARSRNFLAVPSATGGITRLACARLRERGKDVQAILVKAGLSPEVVDDPTARLDARAQIKVLNFAGEELGDELFGFHLARDFDLREIGLVYYVMASSERLVDALRNAERYSGLVNEGVRLRCHPGRDTAVRLEYVDADHPQDRHHIEFWLVTVVRICREVTDSRLAPRRIKVRHLRTGSSGDFKAFFGAEVEFGTDVDEIVLSAPVASLSTVGRDTYLNKLLRRYAEDALSSAHPKRASARSQVEKILPELLPHGQASLSEVARRLGTSPRTLSRKLREEEAGYADILDELRAALARRYLADLELAITEIAWLLGYQEVSSLTHAFRRWTGVTPRQFRNSGCVADAGKSTDARTGRG
jgi:AraC-like DNA-binding protein